MTMLAVVNRVVRRVIFQAWGALVNSEHSGEKLTAQQWARKSHPAPTSITVCYSSSSSDQQHVSRLPRHGGRRSSRSRKEGIACWRLRTVQPTGVDPRRQALTRRGRCPRS